MDLQIRDRVYLVTGGSRGLGYATASSLVAEGARVVLSGRDIDSAQRAAQSLGSNAIGVAADNAAPDTAQRLIDVAMSSFGRLDGALISVGGPPAGTVLGTTDEQWSNAFESVFLGAIRLMREVATALSPGADSPQVPVRSTTEVSTSATPTTTDKCIALVLSTSVRSPIPGLAASNGLRPGLAMLAKTLADEVGPRGIRVVGLMPGRFATDRVAELDASRGNPEEVKAAFEAEIPLRRYGNPREFGSVAAFVLSPAASYLSGIVMPLDGGALRGL